VFEAFTLSRDCFLKHVVEEKIEETRRRGITCKQLMDELKEREDTGNSILFMSVH
jgi:hypothetical protein